MKQLLSFILGIFKAADRKQSFFWRMVMASLIPVLSVSVALLVISMQVEQADNQSALRLRGEQVASAIADAIQVDEMVGKQEHWFKAFRSITGLDATIKRIAIVGPTGETVLGYGEPPSSNDAVVVERAIRSDNAEISRGSVRVELSTYSYTADAKAKRLRLALIVLLVALVGSSITAIWIRAISKDFFMAFTTLFGDDATSMYRSLSVEDLSTAIAHKVDDWANSQHSTEDLVERRTQSLNESYLHARRAEDSNRRLLSLTQDSLEKERSRIAIELHDSVNASLIGMRLLAEAISHKASARGDSEFVTLAEGIIGSATELYDATRKIVEELRPELLESLGFFGAIQEAARRIQESYPSCAVHVHGHEIEGLNESQSIAGFRMVQEALSNIIKHAHATKISVVVEPASAPWIVRVTVADDGLGMQTLEGPARYKHFGLAGMRERVESVGGFFSVSSNSSGTVVTAVI